MTITRLYGLAIRSELPLHQHRPLPVSTPVDVDIVLGHPVPRDDDRPTGRVVLHLDVDRQYYTAVEDCDGYLLRFYDTCDVRVDASLCRASVHPFPGADPGILAVLAGGTVLAFILAMRGEAVLHASAAEVGDEAIAFVGASGMGKSTSATLLCADGAKLVTDDLLRLDLSRPRPTCSLGATELRLRKSASELSERFATTPARRTTGDARDAIAAEPSTTEDLPLRAIVVPVPDREGLGEAVIERRDPLEAFLLLSRFPRLLGWEDGAVMRRQFQQLGDILDAVPVFFARLPWGPPFPDGLAATIRHAVGVRVG